MGRAANPPDPASVLMFGWTGFKRSGWSETYFFRPLPAWLEPPSPSLRGTRIRKAVQRRGWVWAGGTKPGPLSVPPGDGNPAERRGAAGQGLFRTLDSGPGPAPAQGCRLPQARGSFCGGGAREKGPARLRLRGCVGQTLGRKRKKKKLLAAGAAVF